jgi:pantoate--beta-alanine ligase
LKLVQSPLEVAVLAEEARQRLKRVALVPTMGALHAGHGELIARAVRDCDFVVVSIFVNPLQFGPGEDLAAYPRDLEADLEFLATRAVDLVFAPGVEQMYPQPFLTTVHVSRLTERFEGAARPGHFDGVTTVVTKLLAILGPCRAYFGEKDFQQLVVVKKLVADLNLPVEVVACPTVREEDGLALSSRNRYLSPAEREAATVLYRSLLQGSAEIAAGERDPEVVAGAMEQVIAAEPLARLDYAAVVDPVTLEVPPFIRGEVRLLVAAKVGPARLIDNLAVEVPD